MPDVTQILSRIESGESDAAEQLLPLVYDELRKLAAQQLKREKPGQTLEATALVHEAYVRLVDVEQAQSWNSRRHFFAAAAQAMRRILVDRARQKLSIKAGGQRIRQDLEANELATTAAPAETCRAVCCSLAQLAFRRTDRSWWDLARDRAEIEPFAGPPLAA
jgi:RNA polymerase sigma factor (TIGR02999 family)